MVSDLLGAALAREAAARQAALARLHHALAIIQDVEAERALLAFEFDDVSEQLHEAERLLREVSP